MLPPESDGDTGSPEAEHPPLTRAEREALRRGQTEDPYEGAVPPGYDWPTHGGYLGCLMGLVSSCLVAGFLVSTVFAVLAQTNGVARPLYALVAVVIFLACAIGLGRLGWVLGRRFYREYPQRRAVVWGEDDVEDDVPQADVEAGAADDTTHGGENPDGPSGLHASTSADVTSDQA